ncbi:hypothetical protein HUA74_19995 [Myxococcus sp. CA051A]|uniref:hypothetical protein n=1 Tax=unclassified Myxococcus TaxID=2648731 RepID=UPI00157A80D5|nr:MULTISPECIES: hypothetical protein [unclassified Myxococcus]NTX16313.1 hypothetical protein [Myxococcus sp. CA056]NTX62935.1 hypothetical protein [Myxococcus sp. CA051A]
MTRGGWVALMLCCGAVSVEAAEPEVADCDFRWECQVGAHVFSVAFDSASGECTEDDMTAVVETSGGKTGLPLEKAWYGSIANVADGKSVCRLAGAKGSVGGGVSAFAVDDRRALVFFTRDDRPGYEWVGVALIDAATGKVLDVKQRLGQSKERVVAILKTPRGFKLQLIREHLKGVQCDCSAAFADDWMAVDVVNGRIHARWKR